MNQPHPQLRPPETQHPADPLPRPVSPPVVVRTALATEPLSVTEHEDAVAHPSAGAVVSFAGVVRDHDGGRGVVHLVYEAHPSAAAVLAEVAAEIAKDPAVHRLAVSHRVGELAIGDVALAAAVSTAHRADAFAVCARLVDEVKARLPVWKHQHFTDGTDEWVNSP
jgi:molybdopterin synthase catalytic subunit